MGIFILGRVLMFLCKMENIVAILDVILYEIMIGRSMRVITFETKSILAIIVL